MTTLTATARHITARVAPAAPPPLAAPAHAAVHVPAAGVPSTQTITLRGAVAGARGAKIKTRRHGEAPADGLTVTVFRHPDYRTPVHTVTQSPTTRQGVWGRKAQRRLNETGTGQMATLAGDATAAAIEAGDLVRFSLDGDAVVTWIVELIESTTIPKDGREAPALGYSGPEHLAQLRGAPVLPSLGFDVVPVEFDRGFGWQSPAFDDSAWATATAITTVTLANTAITGWPYQPFGGTGFPPVFIIGAHDSTMTSAHIGRCYFRKTFTAPADGDYVFLLAGDNVVELYLDGALVCSSDDTTATATKVVTLSAGDHVLAAMVDNLFTPGDTLPGEAGNPHGLAVGVYPADPSGTATTGTPTVSTDNTWKIVEFPPSPPAMTIGEVILSVITEAQALGWIPGWEASFTKEVDSDGRPWVLATEISTKVGTSLETFLMHELAGTWCDLRAQPGGLVLDAWNLDGQGTDVALTLEAPTDPTDPTSGNLTELTHNVTPPRANQLLVQYQGGWRLVDEAGADDVRRCEPLGLGSYRNPVMVDTIGVQELSRYKREREQIVAGVYPHTLIHEADIGDRVTVPRFDGSTASERIVGWSIDEDRDGVVTVAPELKDVLLGIEERFDETLKKMSNGTLGGTSRVAQPINTTPSTVTCCAPPVPPEGGG